MSASAAVRGRPGELYLEQKQDGMRMAGEAGCTHRGAGARHRRGD